MTTSRSYLIEVRNVTLAAIAADVAKESKCVSLKVGAVLVIGDRIVSTGYNGTAPSYVNCCDKFDDRGPEHSAWSDKYETHAELSALLFCPVSIAGSKMVTTHSPCWNCVKAMVLAGVTQIYYAERYYRQSDSDFQEVVDYCNVMNITFDKVS